MKNQLKTEILHALYDFVEQRPGMDWRDYGHTPSYNRERAKVYNDLKTARDLLRIAERWDFITAEHIQEAASNRLTIKATREGLPNSKHWVVSVDYCTAQYFAVEYRAAVIGVLVSAIWSAVRDDVEIGTDQTREKILKGMRRLGVPRRAFDWT
jgi:hypothetical protein